MYFRTVYVTLILDGKSVQIPISIGCIPTTPMTELFRRAGNILRQASADATFSLEKNESEH